MPRLTLRTDKPVAIDSPDHLYPFGTAQDNSTDLVFNEDLFRLIPAPDVRLLDIGCSGGGFVKSVLDAGGLAVGVEGSDYSKVRQRAEWATIPGSLFTADATHPFQIDCDGEPLTFNVITSWEVLEHIAEPDLDAFFDNIKRHLDPQGMVIVSVCPLPCLHNGERDGDGVALHLTVQPEDWWRQRLAQAGFVVRDSLYARFRSFVRGFPSAPASPNLVFTGPDFVERTDIPKTFHQVWLGGKPFPAEAQAWQDGWRARHPDWQWRVWTDADLPSLESQWALTHAAHLSQKSDIVRYEVLHRFGGVYLDTDMECVRAIDPLLHTVQAFAGREDSQYLCGAIMGGVAGHPLFTALCDGLPHSMEFHARCVDQAGPGYLTRTAAQIPDVTVFGPGVFYPYHWRETHRRFEAFPKAFAVHRWQGTWIDAKSDPAARFADECAVLLRAMQNCPWAFPPDQIGQAAERIVAAYQRYAQTAAQPAQIEQSLLHTLQELKQVLQDRTAQAAMSRAA